MANKPTNWLAVASLVLSIFGVVAAGFIAWGVASTKITYLERDVKEARADLKEARADIRELKFAQAKTEAIIEFKKLTDEKAR